MTRRTRRPAPYVAAHIEDILHTRRLEGQNVEMTTGSEPETAPKDEPPAGKAALSGAKGKETDADAGRVGHSAGVAAPREKTLHELNLEARAIDREHARIREQAAAKANEVLGPMLAGVPRVRTVLRRLQKNLRPQVKD